MNILYSILLLSISLSGLSQTIEEKNKELSGRVKEINETKANGNYALALTKTEKLISEGNEFAELYLLKAQCLMEGKKLLTHNENLYEITSNTLNKAIELAPTYNLPYGRRGLLNLINRRFVLAIEDYTKFISYSTDSTLLFNGYTDRGTAKMYSRDFQGAIKDYEKAITINPNDISIYSNLGAIYIDFGEPEKAMNILSKGLVIYPESTDLLNNLGFLNIKQENFTDAKSYFDQVIEVNENDYLALGNRGFCLIKLKKMKMARADLDKSISLNPDNSYVYMYNAHYYLENANVNEACENLQKANALGFSETYGEEVNQMINLNCK